MTQETQQKEGFNTDPRNKEIFDIGYFKAPETESTEAYNREHCQGQVRWYKLRRKGDVWICYKNEDSRWIVDEIYGNNYDKDDNHIEQPYGSAIKLKNKSDVTIEELKEHFDSLPFNVRNKLLRNIGGNTEIKFSYKQK